jgi:hypothetical protein
MKATNKYASKKVEEHKIIHLFINNCILFKTLKAQNKTMNKI